MNSQIYCLPQKFGWNALPDVGPLNIQRKPFKEDPPYFKVRFDDHDVSKETREEFMRHYPKMGKPCPDSEEKAKAAVYMSETSYSFQPHWIYPKREPPVTFERKADPMRQGRVYLPPFKTLVVPEVPGVHDDPHRGLYEWRRLVSAPADTMWQPMVARDWARDVGVRSTLPPLRLYRHDPTYEKRRWDYIRNLVRNRAVSYPYRRDVVGYTGHKQREEHIMSNVECDLVNPSSAMVSTTQAVYKEFPECDYQESPEQVANKHRGPMSRMVTLTHPYNPYTQQSAYCNVGASGTQ